MTDRTRGVVVFTAVAILLMSGCQSVEPPPEQLAQVNRLVNDRAAVRFDAARLLAVSLPDVPPPAGDLSLQEATERALQRNLSLAASTENLPIAHAQLVQAGLIQNPTLGQSSGLLFPIHPAGALPLVDGNIQQTLNSIFTQPARVSIAKLQEMQANIDTATQAYALAQQVDGKYQEMIHLVRGRELAVRIEDLYARAVRAAEARRRVGIIPTPELNRARLNFEDARRQVRHLSTQYDRAAREMNWLMGYATAPSWRLPRPVIDDVGTVPSLPQLDLLERLGTQYRLDLLRADFDRRLGHRGVELARMGLFPQTTVGVEVARDSQRNLVLGPWLVGIALPIFDPGLVGLELAKAQERKAGKTYVALQGQVRQDVRTAYANWRIAADDVSFFRDRIIPQQEENVRLMETSFRLGNDDLDSLLNVYQSYVSQLQAYEDAIQAYHDSGVALQQAVGLAWDRILAEAGVRPAVKQPATARAPIVPPSASPTAPDLEPLPGGPATSRWTVEHAP